MGTIEWENKNISELICIVHPNWHLAQTFPSNPCLSPVPTFSKPLPKHCPNPSRLKPSTNPSLNPAKTLPCSTLPKPFVEPCLEPFSKPLPKPCPNLAWTYINPFSKPCPNISQILAAWNLPQTLPWTLPKPFPEPCPNLAWTLPWTFLQTLGQTPVQTLPEPFLEPFSKPCPNLPWNLICTFLQTFPKPFQNPGQNPSQTISLNPCLNPLNEPAIIWKENYIPVYIVN